MATISDVAKLAGMSVSTVSRVINNKPHVSEAKRKRVEEAMAALGYSPLPAARQMRGSGSGNIAVVVPTITNSFFANLVDSIERECRKYEYKTLITQTYGKKSNEERSMSLLSQHHADGVILCSIENDWEMLKSYLNYGKLVACNEYNDDNSVSIIRARQYEGFYKATEYLLGKGHRNIAYCTGSKTMHIAPAGANIDSDRYTGYLDALGNQGISANQKWLFRGVGTVDDGRRVVHQLMSLTDKPQAIIAGSDAVAVGMVLEAEAMGLRIPEDLAIMGVDDQPIASYISVPLTTIRQPVQEEGRMAAREMVRQLTEDATDARSTELDLEIVVRHSA